MNTFVLICSSLTVVLAHFESSRKNFQKATVYVLITLALGAVFLVVKAYEYNAKFEHDILPGHIGELVIPRKAEGNRPSPVLSVEREKLFHATGMDYVNRVRGQLNEILQGVIAENLEEQAAIRQGDSGSCERRWMAAPFRTAATSPRQRRPRSGPM